ncbi:MAG: hypothetical protein OXU19_00245, partial [bacterium]|nr:hypothetical protein [bacterium]
LVSTHAEIGVDMRPHLPTSSANFRTAILKDTEWYASLHDRIVARFDAWLGQSETNHTDQATTDAVAEGQDDRSD